MRESLALAEHIARTRYEDIPASAADVTKKSLLDGLGVTLAAGTLGEGCQSCVSLAMEGGGKEESTIIGFGVRVPAIMAAFANGSMAHALDFEDTHEGALVHPNAAVIPAAFAMAESIGNTSGEQLIAALALGSDIVSRLGLALLEDPIKYGWYTPPILGAFGATTAAAKLLKLGPEQILDAFSFTLCQATCSAELTHSPRSVVRAIRDAFSAKAGVISAQLAARGAAGFEQPLEGKAGLFPLYARDEYDLSRLTRGLGEIFEGANVSFKPWPSCRGTHAFIEATLNIVKSHHIKPADIEDIRLFISPGTLSRALCEPLETKRRPKTAIDAKFSVPFTVALAAAGREISLEHFTPQALADPEVVEVAGKVSYEQDSALKPGQGRVELRTKGGVVSAKTPAFTYGHPNNPISNEALIGKFIDCAGHSAQPIPKDNLNRFIEIILHLEDVKRVKKEVLVTLGRRA